MVGGEAAEPACSSHTDSMRGGSSLLPARLPEEQDSPSPQQSPKGSVTIPASGNKSWRGKLEVEPKMAGLASPPPLPPHPAQRKFLLQSHACCEGRDAVSVCCQPSLSHAAMTTTTCTGEGDVAARNLRRTLATSAACFSPSHFQILSGFCSDQPQLCQGRV